MFLFHSVKWFLLFQSNMDNVFKYCYVSLTIQLNICNSFIHLNVKTVLFLTTQLSIYIYFIKQFYLTDRFDLIWCYHFVPEKTWEQCQWSGLLHILQNSRITGASPSDCLVSYPRHLLKESYSSTEMQSVYSAVLADWASSESRCYVYHHHHVVPSTWISRTLSRHPSLSSIASSRSSGLHPILAQSCCM